MSSINMNRYRTKWSRKLRQVRYTVFGNVVRSARQMRQAWCPAEMLGESTEERQSRLARVLEGA